MKIAWFSPRLPDHNGIAHYTEMLVPELKRVFDVRFFAEKAEGIVDVATGHLWPAQPGQPVRELLPVLNDFDVTIYNLGNSQTFFAHTWFLNELKPGIVILHDVRLHHFFAGLFCTRLHDQRSYVSWLEQYYGSPGAEAGRLYCQQHLSIDFMAENFPMTAWGVGPALAAVVHTPEAQATLASESAVPVILHALPNDAHGSRAAASAPQTESHRANAFSASNPARLAMFGFFGANRRIENFLRAWAEMPERESFELHVYGEFLGRHGAAIRDAARSLDLLRRIEFHGYVAEEALDAGLASCDLAINLRYPTAGEASASQLRIWDQALPSLVTQTGSYANLPADAVSFVRLEHELADIQKHLRALLVEPGSFRAQGQCGRAHLLAHHSPETYVRTLAGLCDRLIELRSRRNQFSMAATVGREVAAWNSSPQIAREESYAQTISEVF